MFAYLRRCTALAAQISKGGFRSAGAEKPPVRIRQSLPFGKAAVVVIQESIPISKIGRSFMSVGAGNRSNDREGHSLWATEIMNIAHGQNEHRDLTSIICLLH
jgi:hypothetical protein